MYVVELPPQAILQNIQYLLRPRPLNCRIHFQINCDCLEIYYHSILQNLLECILQNILHIQFNRNVSQYVLDAMHNRKSSLISYLLPLFPFLYLQTNVFVKVLRIQIVFMRLGSTSLIVVSLVTCTLVATQFNF